MAGSQNIWILAADNNVNALLPILRRDPSLAASRDFSGYSLVHAAASYGHLSLLRQLTTEFHVDVNVKDEDGESALFQVENVDVAKVLLEELHADPQIRNTDGMTAAEKIESEGDFPLVAAYLRDKDASSSENAQDPSGDGAGQASSELDGVHAPPPLPPEVSVNVGTMEEAPPASDEDVADPELRRRIQELAAREDFQSEDGQKELRDLITTAVRGHVADGSGDGRDVRRRTG